MLPSAEDRRVIAISHFMQNGFNCQCYNSMIEVIMKNEKSCFWILYKLSITQRPYVLCVAMQLKKERCSWIHYWLHYSIRRYQDECSNNLSWLQPMFLSSHKENMQSCKPQFVPAGGANVVSHKVQTVCRCRPQIFDAKSRIGRAKKCHDFGLSINVPV